MNKRPVSVTVIAILYLAVGALGFFVHGREILATHGFHWDDFLVELLEIVAFVSGAFLLRGQNWARWLAVAWIAFHVILSAFDPWQKLAVHVVLCALIAWALFCPPAARYFRGTNVA